MTDTAPAPALAGVPARYEACYCCGKPVAPDVLVRFGRHPESGVCVGCARWLYRRSRPIRQHQHSTWWDRFTGGPHRDHE